MVSHLQYTRNASPGPASPPSPRPAVHAARLSPASRADRADAVPFGIFVAALLFVMLPVLWRPASLALALALFGAAGGAVLVAAVVGAARSVRQRRLSRR